MSFPRSPRFPPEKQDILASPADYNLRENFVRYFNGSIRLSKLTKDGSILGNPHGNGNRTSSVPNRCCILGKAGNSKCYFCKRLSLGSWTKSFRESLKQQRSNKSLCISSTATRYSIKYSPLVQAILREEPQNVQTEENIPKSPESDRTFVHIDGGTESFKEGLCKKNSSKEIPDSFEVTVGGRCLHCNSSRNRNANKAFNSDSLKRTFCRDLDYKQRIPFGNNINKNLTLSMPSDELDRIPRLMKHQSSPKTKAAEESSNKNVRKSRHKFEKENKPPKMKPNNSLNVRPLDSILENPNSLLPSNKFPQNTPLLPIKHTARVERKTKDVGVQTMDYSLEGEIDDKFKIVIVKAFLEIHKNVCTTNNLLKNIESLVEEAKEGLSLCNESMKFLSEQILSIITDNSLSEKDVSKMWDYYDLYQTYDCDM